MRRLLAALLMALMTVGLLSSPALADDEEDEGPPPGTIVEETLALNDATGDFDILIAALTFATDNGVDLIGTLSGDGPFTVYGPTDQAFIKLAEGISGGPVAEEDAFGVIAGALDGVYDGDVLGGLVDVLTYHVAAGDDFEGRYVTMVNGDSLRVGRHWLKDATGQWVRIIAGPVDASNGRIFAINKVLLPEAFVPQPGTIVEETIALNDATGDFDILIAALTFATENGVNLIGVLSGDGPFTVYGPNDDAFIGLAESISGGPVAEGDAFGVIAGALDGVYDGDVLGGLVDVLTYHVKAGDPERGRVEMVNGDVLRVGRSWLKDATGQWVRIVAGPVDASNGTIFAVNRVLLPKAFVPKKPNIVEKVIELNDETGNFDILIGALTFATENGVDLIGALSGDDTFTVYGPTDQAFINLAEGISGGPVAEGDAFGIIAGALTSVYDGDTLGGLVDVLTYHVKPGNPRWGDVTMANGEQLRVWWIFLQDQTGQWSRIISGRVAAENGSIYAINRVLLPSAFN